MGVPHQGPQTRSLRMAQSTLTLLWSLKGPLMEGSQVKCLKFKFPLSLMYKIPMVNFEKVPYHMSNFRTTLSLHLLFLGSMSHDDFKKCPGRRVKFQGRGPLYGHVGPVYYGEGGVWRSGPGNKGETVKGQ